MLKITAVVRTYNRPQWLPQMLDCLVNQDYDDYEVIIFNNGSTDSETETIIKHYVDTYKHFFSVAQNVNSRQKDYLQLPVEAYTSGDYITWLDDDDRCEPHYLSFLASLALSHQADIAICGSYNEYMDGTLQPYFVGDDLLVMDKLAALTCFLQRQHFNTAPPTKLFRKELLVSSPAWMHLLKTVQTPPSEDVFYTYRYMEQANKVVVHNRPLYYFKKHDSNDSIIQHDDSHWSPGLMKGYLEAYRIREHYLLERHPSLKPVIIQATTDFMTSMLSKIEKNKWSGYDHLKAYMEAYINVF